jgi:hypothetical protein
MFFHANRGEMLAFSSRLGALVLAASSIALMASACGGPPKQAEAPDVEKESGVDMAATADSSGAPAETGGGEQEMRSKCCVECKAGAAKDRTGAQKSSIPCADFTDTLSPWCLEHFRAHPAKASECE